MAGRLLEFGVLRRLHPLLSARLAALAHPVGAVALLLAGAPLAPVFAVLHGAGNGILTIAKGTLPLALFGPAGYGARQGLLMVPSRFAPALEPVLVPLRELALDAHVEGFGGGTRSGRPVRAVSRRAASAGALGHCGCQPDWA